MRRSGPPALHFLAMGVALFTLERVAVPRRPPGPPPPPAAPLLTPDRLAQLRADFTRQAGVPPTPDEEQALAAQAIDDEILYREALVHRLDRDDRSIRYRLAEKRRFLGHGQEGDAAGDERAPGRSLPVRRVRPGRVASRAREALRGDVRGRRRPAARRRMGRPGGFPARSPSRARGGAGTRARVTAHRRPGARAGGDARGAPPRAARGGDGGAPGEVRGAACRCRAGVARVRLPRVWLVPMLLALGAARVTAHPPAPAPLA